MGLGYPGWGGMDGNHSHISDSADKVGIGGYMNWLLKFIPEDKRALLELAIRITASLDTAEERKAVAAYGLEMLSPDSDGGTRCTVGEWSKFGSKLGVLRGPGPR